MIRSYVTTLVSALALVLVAAPAARAQTFDAWVEARIQALLDAQQIGQNGKGADKQRETPAADSRSTSLVDSSSSTDFVSAAVNLATVAAGSSGSGTTGSQAVTASLYALMAGLNGKTPTDPQFYRDHMNARRASFTVGTAVSDVKKDNTDKAATVLGVKILVFNGRELYKAKNLAAIRAAQKALTGATVAGAVLKRRIQEILLAAAHPNDALDANGAFKPALFLTAFGDATFVNTLKSVGPEVLKKLDAEIVSAMATFVDLRKAVQTAYDTIQQGGQFAVVYSASIRQGDGFDRHRAEFVYDYGLSHRVTWTANGSWDYVDKKAMGHESTGRAATEFSGDLTTASEGWSRQPIRLSGSGQVTWALDQPAAKEFQAKLSLPVTGGIEIPLVYRYSSATSQSSGGNEGKLGFTIDLSRLMQAAK